MTSRLTGASGPGPADIMPPLALPGIHFGAGVLWLVVGGVGLVAVAPDLAQGGFLAPRAIAVTHAFTLGWITTAIFGALYQLYPVALGVAARSIRWGFAGFVLLQFGTVAVVSGAWWWKPALLATGWLLLAGAVGIVAANILPQRRTALRGRQVGRYVTLGHSALGLAMAVVLVRIGSAFGWWPADRLGLLAAHVHLAAVGFATLTAVGVGSKVLPMFLLSRHEGAIGWIGPVAGSGLVLHAIGAIWQLRPLFLVGTCLVAGAIVGWLWVIRGYYRTSARRRLEPGLAYVAIAFVFLTVTVALALAMALVPGMEARRLAAYGVLGILGWLGLFIVGVSFKILPFLTWLHRFSPRVGEERVPKVADLTSTSLQWATLVFLAPGIATLAVAIALGMPVLSRGAAAVVLAGLLLVAVQHAGLMWRKA